MFILLDCHSRAVGPQTGPYLPIKHACKVSWFLLLCGLVISSLTGTYSVAAEPQMAVTQVNVGLGKMIRSGFWARIRFSLTTSQDFASAKVYVVTLDGDRAPVRYLATSAKGSNFTSGQASTFESFVKVGPENATWSIQVEGEGSSSQTIDISSQIGRPLGSKREWWLTLGNDVGMELARDVGRRPDDVAVACSSITSSEDLPSEPWQYDGVEYVGLSTGGNEVWNNASPAQKKALLDWVRRGGRLLVCLSGSPEDAAKSKALLLELIPGMTFTPEPLKDTAGLETFTSEPLEWQGSDSRQIPIVCNLQRIDDPSPNATVPPSPVNALPSEILGRIELAEGGSAGDVPIVARQAMGLGQVLLVCVDLADPTFVEWRGRARLVSNLLASPETTASGDKAGRRASGSSRMGYDDLTGQLRAALDRFPSVWPINFTAASLFTLAYLLLMGPADYFVLSRLGIARHWTWFTFPMIVALIAGGAWWTSQRAHGHQLLSNQLILVDIDQTQQVTRGTLWGSLYSPDSQQIDVAVNQPDLSWLRASDQPTQFFNWQGLPGTGLGGLSSRQVAFGQGTFSTISPPAAESPTISGLAMHAASTKNVAASWSGTHQLPSPGRLYLDEYGRLMGELTSPFPFDLSECIIAQQEWFYRVKEWKAGQSINMADLTPLSLESRLTLQSLTDTKGRITPWQRDSTELPRILQMLMFHDTVRGSNYTGLTHRYQNTLDLSQHLKLGCAVIIGQAKDPAATFAVSKTGAMPEKLNLQSQDLSYYRLVLPVEPKRGTAAKLPKAPLLKQP